MARPKWATPARQAHLVSLFTRSKGFCVFGHKPCPCPEHHYEVFIEGLIADWVADDRAGIVAEWREERSHMHRLADRRYPLHGQFSAVASSGTEVIRAMYALRRWGKLPIGQTS